MQKINLKKLREKNKKIKSKNHPKNAPQKVPELHIFETKEVDQFKVIKTIDHGA